LFASESSKHSPGSTSIFDQQDGGATEIETHSWAVFPADGEVFALYVIAACEGGGSDDGKSDEEEGDLHDEKS
jgi:hypothetical protein